MKPTHFIVIYDDGDCLRNPYGWDDDCVGAITGSCLTGGVAIFETRQEAQSAIQISAAYAKLCKAQGRPVNSDFTEYRRNIKITPCLPRA